MTCSVITSITATNIIFMVLQRGLALVVTVVVIMRICGLSLLGPRARCLCFLPGMADIDRTARALGGGVPGARIHRLHGSLSPEEQDAALAESRERKIILATNVAETSITVDGVTTVVRTKDAKITSPWTYPLKEVDPSTWEVREFTFEDSGDEADDEADDRSDDDKQPELPPPAPAPSLRRNSSKAPAKFKKPFYKRIKDPEGNHQRNR